MLTCVGHELKVGAKDAERLVDGILIVVLYHQRRRLVYPLLPALKQFTKSLALLLFSIKWNLTHNGYLRPAFNIHLAAHRGVEALLDKQYYRRQEQSYEQCCQYDAFLVGERGE